MYRLFIYGHAHEDGMLERSKYETILAYAKSTILFSDAIKKMTRDGTEKIFRYPKGKLLGQKQQPVEIKRPDTVVAWEKDELPLIAVTEILDKQPGGGGTADAVFYRYEFRDLTTAIKQRGPNWNKLVTAQSVRARDTVLSIKEEKFRRAQDTTKVILEPNQSFANEILCLSLGFKRSKETWFLKELQNVFAEIDGDLNYRPPRRNAGLRKFIEEEEFSEEDARAVVEEVKGQWPEIVDITTERILRLKEGLICSNAFLEYRLLRAFLAEGTYKLKMCPEMTDDELFKATQDIIGTANRMMPVSKSTPPISVTEETALLETLHNKLKEMRDAGKSFEQNLKALCGDSVLEGTPYDFWSHYADALDTDSARLAFFQVARYFVMAQRHKNIGLDSMASDIADVLKNLTLGDR
ncbi:MAG: hypothetical protein M1840_001864 [Geoglossum simile]|nr:MAG: hypothetical protein M1840_001864 [Geoglossum simile]